MGGGFWGFGRLADGWMDDFALLWRELHFCGGFSGTLGIFRGWEIERFMWVSGGFRGILGGD